MQLQITNPIHPRLVYRVTTTRSKDINGRWSFKAKVFFKTGSTRAVHEIYGDTGSELAFKIREFEELCRN